MFILEGEVNMAEMIMDQEIEDWEGWNVHDFCSVNSVKEIILKAIDEVDALYKNKECKKQKTINITKNSIVKKRYLIFYL